MNMIVLDRKPIFDAVRHLLSRAFTAPEVVMLDHAIDIASDQCASAARSAVRTL